MYYFQKYNSPVGEITLASTEKALVGLWIRGQKYFLGRLRQPMTEGKEIPVLRQTSQWLDRYFAGGKPSPWELPLAPEGSPFQKEVWQILCEIPWGGLMTYGDIAGRLARARGLDHMSAQAVGGAVGHNPVSIIIPCHRVVGANGSLTGYAGGIEKKIALLTLEGAPVAKLFVPKRGTAL